MLLHSCLGTGVPRHSAESPDGIFTGMWEWNMELEGGTGF